MCNVKLSTKSGQFLTIDKTFKLKEYEISGTLTL